jgi:uncharacterized membrane protein YuzA (DUF378 family)
MKSIKMLAYWLLVIGGLNWLLVGVFGWDISRWLGGQEGIVSRVIYIVVGVSAIISLFGCKKCNCGGNPQA